MKNIMKIFPVLLISALLFLGSAQLFGQNGPPPPPPGGHGQTGNQPTGGTAPIGSGVALMLVMGSLYAGKKMIVKNEE